MQSFREFLYENKLVLNLIAEMSCYVTGKCPIMYNYLQIARLKKERLYSSF